MRQLLSGSSIPIPDGVTVEVKARKVRVKGPRGEHLDGQGRSHFACAGTTVPPRQRCHVESDSARDAALGSAPEAGVQLWKRMHDGRRTAAWGEPGHGQSPWATGPRGCN